MQLCQIIPYGGEELWIKLALREFPETRWLIILANKPKPRPLTKYEEIKEKQELSEQKDYYEEAKTLLKQFEQKENEIIDAENLPMGLPPEQRKKFSLLEPISLENFYELLRYFRALLALIIQEGYKVAIHLNSGPMMWRICLYLAASEFKKDVDYLYLFEKFSGERKNIWIYRDLTEQEKIIIEILSENPKLSISDIQKFFKKRKGKGTLSYILKIIKVLINDGLISELKRGRTKWVELTLLGKSLSSFNDYIQKITQDLNQYS